VNGPVIETMFNASRDTLGETTDYLRFWKGKVDHARVGSISLAFKEHDHEAVFAVTRTGACTQIYERMPITWNGLVTQCVVDVDGDQIVGDLNKDSISDVWNSERMRMVRQIHHDRTFEKLPMCLHCDM
jgi:radical SAM protein with 4Fe4S-binding SPASM domain